MYFTFHETMFLYYQYINSCIFERLDRKQDSVIYHRYEVCISSNEIYLTTDIRSNAQQSVKSPQTDFHWIATESLKQMYICTYSTHSFKCSICLEQLYYFHSGF